MLMWLITQNSVASHCNLAIHWYPRTDEVVLQAINVFNDYVLSEIKKGERGMDKMLITEIMESKGKKITALPKKLFSKQSLENFISHIP